MQGKRWALALPLAAVLAGGAAGCKPPPTDSAAARVMLDPPVRGPSEPIASPDVTGAVWAATADPLRLVYGKPGEPVLLALECLAPASPEAAIRITRHAPADEGAGALLALIGHGEVGRFPVDATRVGGRLLWQGDVPAAAPQWAALEPGGEATVTVPGAGLLTLTPSPLPMALIDACRGPDFAAEAAGVPTGPEAAPGAVSARR